LQRDYVIVAGRTVLSEAEADKLERIDRAFREGSLQDLRAALDDPDALPNGAMPDAIGPCLVYAIYRSPLAFIRTLLDLGADPNAPADDGFPPLMAALSCGRAAPGATPRTDVVEIVRLLLAYGVDPNQRGINDYTPLHMAVGERNPLAVQVLLDGGADPELRTRIDDCDTPLEMATAAGLTDIAAILSRRGQPVHQRVRSGVTLLWDIPGTGDLVRRQHTYDVRLRFWLRDGQTIRWQIPSGPVGVARLENDGEVLVTQIRTSRGRLINGLFYGIEGMRVGGVRKLEIAPHMAYGDRGVPGAVPPNTAVVVEIEIVSRQSRVVSDQS
jgi:ankyrin repeat protein